MRDFQLPVAPALGSPGGIQAQDIELAAPLNVRYVTAFLTGWLNGFLPCGLVLGALSRLAATGSTTTAAVGAVAFGGGNDDIGHGFTGS